MAHLSAHSMSISDYKRTSLKTCVQVFEKFLLGLEKTWKGKLLEQSGKYCNTFHCCEQIIWLRFLRERNLQKDITGARKKKLQQNFSFSYIVQFLRSVVLQSAKVSMKTQMLK